MNFTLACRHWRLFLMLATLFALAGCATRGIATAGIPQPTAIDAEASRLMALEQVTGLALAVIDDGQIVHVQAYGQRNVEKGLPLTTDTVMYGASLTKTVAALLVMQLVEEGRLSLDATTATLLPKPLPDFPDYADLADDTRWRFLTPRLLLSHQSGFANFRWIDADQKLRFHRTPGTRYGYSGEGFYVLQTMLEEGLRLDVGAEIQQRLFDRFGLTHTSLQWRPDFADNLADGYRDDGSFEVHDERSSVSIAGSMDTSISDQARLWAGVMRGEAINPGSRAAWLHPQIAIDSRSQFPTLVDARDARGPAINLGAALGTVVFDGAQGKTWFKGGHNDSTGNMLVCIEAKRRCLVMLANSVRAERIYPALTQFILGNTGMPWWWEYGSE